MSNFNTERYPCICLAPKESDISRRFGAICPRDENDIFHPVDPQSFVSYPGKPSVDMLDHPLAKILLHYGILSLGLYWKG